MEIAFKPSPLKLKDPVLDFVKRIKKLGNDDPRRIVHSFKVALAITLVSMVYYLRPLYKGMGDSGIWAILTVVVVFEYTAGATLCKGMNRGLATLLAGALGLGAEYMARLFGPRVEPIVLGCLVFLLVATATFSRFIPHIKRRYDYGVLIFILTFSLVAVSGYRVHKIIDLAHQRLSTIIVGGATCIIISIFVCPVWAGEDLHNLIVSNLEKVANFLEGFGGELFDLPINKDTSDTSNIGHDKSFLTAYKSVLNSKATEESLANFAWWEPGHGKFRFSHPWKQYLKIGVLTRQCAYHVEALSGYLDAKYHPCSEFRKSVQEPCTKMSSEAGKALKELALSIKTFSYPSNSAMHIQSCKKAIDGINTTLQTLMVGEHDVLEIIPIITVISILIDVVKCIETIFEAIEELSKQARFKKPLMDKIEKPQVVHGGDTVEDDKGFVSVVIQIGSESSEIMDTRG